MKYDEYTEKNTFLISSDNCVNTKSGLYGYVIHDDVLYLDYDIELRNCSSIDIGAYVIVQCSDDHIDIIRDTMGLGQLYLFRKKNYWAISNSFWKLCDEVSTCYRLSLNKGYAEALFYFNMMPYVFGGTLCKDIVALSAFDEIHIDIKGKSIYIKTNNNLYNRVSLDSIEGMRILDDWIYRWSAIIKGLERGQNQMFCELSGGYDSRVTFALAEHAGIDFDDKKRVLYSYEPISRAAKNHFKGDMEIAKQLADIKKKKINSSEVFLANTRLSSLDGVKAYREIYEGFMVQAFCPDRWYTNPTIRLGGHMGESVRAYRHDEKTITHKICIGTKADKSLVKGYMSLVKSYGKICELTGNPDADDDVNSLRLEVECMDGIFFGKQIICSLISNIVMISPFMDISLRRLDVGEDINPILMYAVILQRICPEFLEIELNGNRKFTGEIKKIARLLCEKYPFENRQIEEKTITIKKKSENIEFEQNDDGDALQLLKKMFSEDRVRKEIIDRMGDTGKYMYEKAQRSLEDEDRFANETYMMAVLAIDRMIGVEKRSGKDNLD